MSASIGTRRSLLASLFPLVPWKYRQESAGSAGDSGSFPNVVLTSQDGVAIRLYDDLVKGRVVLINFMFTTCGSYCPRATENLTRVAEGLGARLGGDVRMISITVDPKRDTPGVLKQYAARFNTPPGWYFLTGSEKDIDAIRRHLGVNRDGNDKMDHTGVVVYGNDRTGQWAMTPAVTSPRTILWSVTGLLDQ